MHHQRRHVCEHVSVCWPWTSNSSQTSPHNQRSLSSGLWSTKGAVIIRLLSADRPHAQLHPIVKSALVTKFANHFNTTHSNSTYSYFHIIWSVVLYFLSTPKHAWLSLAPLFSHTSAFPPSPKVPFLDIVVIVMGTYSELLISDIRYQITSKSMHQTSKTSVTGWVLLNRKL